jgi:Uncharacterized conserved protein
MHPQSQLHVTPEEAQGIAKEVHIYGVPLVDSYRILYSYFVERDDKEFKATWNKKVFNNSRVFTPEDTAMQTPNSDTPYSQLGLDLRAEPMVLTVPGVEKNRYYTTQPNDLYTFISGYIGSRTTGNDAGKYNLPARLLVANPLNRYLINSPMLPDLKKDADARFTCNTSLWEKTGRPTGCRRLKVRA